MRRIFISHTTDSQDYARGLKEAFKDFADAFFINETEMSPGRSIAEDMRKKLESADCIVVLLTERSVESPWVLFEIGAAEALGKQILPVLLAELDMDRLDYLIRDLAYVDARSLRPSQAAQLIKGLTENKY